MRKFFTLIVIVITVLFLGAAHLYWKEKTSAYAPAPKVEKKDAASSKGKTKKPVKSEAKDVLASTANWPKKAQDAFKKAVEEGRPYNIAFVGSESVGKEDGGWSVMLQEAMDKTYGDTVEVELFEYAERSDEFINNGHADEVAKFNPDFVLFEPFTLNDNGNVEVEDSQENILTFISTVKEQNEDALVVLQPPHPIHGATFYPSQVNQLKEFANVEGLDYLDHWSEWPEPENEELRTYLQDKQSAPNEKGHEVWFEFLRDYFIAK
ncbi:SGNH/GDSL hydrolase family protein [Bacillus norwichensis]|uniref:SGNH/GDSL hydrolase family protein n=1 Tax=Bacillus norwichensis TaxID=2762217 RepID=A0ABR8VHV9_9BACI|nr:SGNH/GDSL hydrolase family protein [Bacillus norwichensis]MBD8004267.1 SGNH/GDSL hydrolase family protein [Bacillus norwichensis]